jgi:hypothetical protein
VLLLRCLGPRRAEGSGARYVRAHWFGHAHLVGMSKLALVWLCKDGIIIQIPLVMVLLTVLREGAEIGELDQSCRYR